MQMLTRSGSVEDQLLIPDGKWCVRFNTDYEEPRQTINRFLPVEFLTDTSPDMRQRLHDFLRYNSYAVLAHEPITVTKHVGVPFGKQRRRVYSDSVFDEDVSYEPNLKEVFVADQPFLFFYGGIWGCLDDAIGASSTFLQARQVCPGKRKVYPKASRPRFIRGAVNWNWARMSELSEVLGLDPTALWKFYYHIAIGATWISTADLEYGFTFAWGDTPEQTWDTREVRLLDDPPAPIRFDHVYSGDLGYQEYLDHTKVFSRVDWNKIWVPATWAMRICYLHHFGFRPQ